jgi:hypothetical protein
LVLGYHNFSTLSKGGALRPKHPFLEKEVFMKVFINADIEGITGIANWHETQINPLLEERDDWTSV